MSGEIFLGVSASGWLESDLISDSSHLFYVASLISWKEKKGLEMVKALYLCSIFLS